MTFIDPLQAVKKQEADDRLPFVYPEEFYFKYKEQPDGSQKREEWVIVTKKGMQNPQKTPMRWKDVARTPSLLQVLKPFYDSWKEGQDAPVVGTPLEAWLADAGLIKVLNSVGVRSVEDFAEMPGHHLTRLNIPSVTEKQVRAKAFLAAQSSTSKVSAEIAQVRGENESLRRELDEMKALIEKHAIKVATEQNTAVRRGPGRPRKNVDEAIN